MDRLAGPEQRQPPAGIDARYVGDFEQRPGRVRRRGGGRAPAHASMPARAGACRGASCADSVRCRLAFLHHRAAAQDGDAVGHVGDHREVVRDQQQAHAVLVDEVAQQFQDLLLQHDVERRGRLVGDQQLRLQRAGDGDDDALALAAGQLVRIARQRKFCLGQPDPVEHFSRTVLGVAAVGAGVPAYAFGDLLADRLDRVQRRHRLLEHHADVVAAQRAHLVFGRARECRCRRSARCPRRAPRREAGA